MRLKKSEFLANTLAGRSKAATLAILTDLLTPAEIEDLWLRCEIVRKLLDGVPQREIARELGVSIAKVTRGSLALQNSEGGFKLALG